MIDHQIESVFYNLYNSNKLKNDEKIELNIKLAKIVLPVWELKYKNDFRVRNCIEDPFNEKKANICLKAGDEKFATYLTAANVAYSAFYIGFGAASYPSAAVVIAKYNKKIADSFYKLIKNI